MAQGLELSLHHSLLETSLPGGFSMEDSRQMICLAGISLKSHGCFNDSRPFRPWQGRRQECGPQKRLTRHLRSAPPFGRRLALRATCNLVTPLAEGRGASVVPSLQVRKCPTVIRKSQPWLRRPSWPPQKAKPQSLKIAVLQDLSSPPIALL